MDLGIGVITYNRAKRIVEFVQKLLKFTSDGFTLVVADDGSTDNTIEDLHNLGVRIIRGSHQGIAFNRNRCLYYLLNQTNHLNIVLMDDDSTVWEYGWNDDWERACVKWDHVNWSYENKVLDVEGLGGPYHPYWCKGFQGNCTITSRRVLEIVGYQDTRFENHGCEWIEWSQRCRRVLRDSWNHGDLYPCMNCHVGVDWPNSWYTESDWNKNLEIMRMIQETDLRIYKPYGETPQDRRLLEREVLCLM